VPSWDPLVTASARVRSVRARECRTSEAAALARALTGVQAGEKTTMVYRSMNAFQSFVDLPDRDLLIEVKRLAQGERAATAALVASLAELDARALHRGEGCPSLFAYCMRVLHLSESAAYARIGAARAGREFPIILERLASGELTLTTVCLLAPHLTAANHREVLDAARHKSKREVERLVAALDPQPDVASVIRKLPAPKVPDAAIPCDRPAATPSLINAPDAVSILPLPPTSASAAPAPAVVAPPIPSRLALVAPLAPERYKVQFTVSQKTHDQLRRAQDLLRHAVPSGDPAEIFARALTLLVEHLERTKFARVMRPREPRGPITPSRHIPSSVKRAVWTRDGGCCAFEGAEGRCGERGFLEFHHVVPYADGGAASEENIQLRCRAHNQFEAEELVDRRELSCQNSLPV
jgi:hypothetical protein